MGDLTSLLRLVAAVAILVRADALAPREFEAVLSPVTRQLARLLRLFAGGRARRGRPGERLAGALERLGPVGIKLGQFLSTRADILGVEFATDLSRLKDRLPPFPTGEARREIEAAFAVCGFDLLAELGEPVAAASLAQAHRARLTDGREVAVKVLRPGIERRVARDAASLKLGAAMAERFAPASRRLAPRAFVATVVRSLELELDMRLEAAGADELAAAMKADGFIEAPAVVWPAVSRRVLVMEWAAGAPLSDPSALEAPGIDRPAMARRLIRGFLSQALDHGVFHADLHEGNLFIAAPARITAVDFGIIGRLSEAERSFLARVVWGFLQRDYAGLAEAHFLAGYVGAGQDRAAFAQALRAVGEPIFGRKASDVSMGRLLAQLFEVTALFDMALRPELVLLQKTMVTVEGVGRRIDPELDMWAAAEPVVRRWMERELAPSLVLRRAAREAHRILAALASLIEREAASRGEAAPAVTRRAPISGWSAFVAGAFVAAAAFFAALVLRGQL